VPPQARRRSSKYDLVSFEHPPVAEVAISVQFAPETVDVEVLGLFSSEVRKELPVRQRQPVSSPMVETFDRMPTSPSFEIRIDEPTSFPRTWFLSEDGTELVQLQHDRFSLNWRELDRGVEYPGYERLRDRFTQLLDRLAALLKEEVGTRPVINLCEVTYVNPVEPQTGARSDQHPDLAKIINRLRPRPKDAFLPEAEDAQLHARWRIPAQETDREGAPAAGRLYLAATPGLKPATGAPIYLVNLTARVFPSGDGADDALNALDVGHKWVVLGFKDLTTAPMHRRWGFKEKTT